MADYIEMLKNEDLIDIAESYNYQMNYMGQKLFPSIKTKNLKASTAQISAGGNIPTIAPVTAFDSEARIGDRPNFEEFKAEKFFIKQKINQGERLRYYKEELGVDFADLKNYIYDDANNLLSSVVTRTEVMNMELIGTGKVTITENNISKSIDYGIPATNRIVFSDWNDVDHDIIADIETARRNAKEDGYTFRRAITSSLIMGAMLKNTGIKSYWANSISILNENNLKTWLLAQFQIEFVVNDDIYQDKYLDGTTYRFFPEYTIAFLATDGTLGQGLYAPTPDELSLLKGDYSEKMMCTIKQWKTEDPNTTWTMASGIYLPVLKDRNQLYIATMA